MAHEFGKTLLIANPSSQSGRGQAAIEVAEKLLREDIGDQLTVILTQYAKHAQQIAADCGASFDTVIALGGDGVIHEVVNGLMQLVPGARPAFGIIPVGSGNDYAKSLGITPNAEKAVKQLLAADARPVDLGHVNDEFFTETVSFGLCAAIAVGTEARRQRTGQSGLMLYAMEGLDQLLHHLDFHPFRMEAELEDGSVRKLDGQAILVAANNGETYGGGFKICPGAQIDDGLLDVCVAYGPVSKSYATVVFLSAKDGGHLKFKKTVETFRARKLRIEFDDVPAAQVDGEAFHGETYEVSVEHQALRVLH